VLCILHILIIYNSINAINHVRINSVAVSNELCVIAATRTRSTTMTTANDDIWRRWVGHEKYKMNGIIIYYTKLFTKHAHSHFSFNNTSLWFYLNSDFCYFQFFFWLKRQRGNHLRIKSTVPPFKLNLMDCIFNY